MALLGALVERIGTVELYELVLNVEGGTVRLVVEADTETHRTKSITISKPWQHDEVIQVRRRDSLSGLCCAGQWDLQQVNDLLLPCPAFA
jgi:hypothetical protein